MFVNITQLFDGHYDGWRKSRIETTLNLVKDGFFNHKKILEVGAGHAHIGNFFQSQFDCQVTSSDGRSEHVEVIKNKIASGEYSPKLLVRQDDMDKQFVSDSRFDVLIHWGLLYHLSDIPKHMTDILQYVDYVFLETQCNNENVDYITCAKSGYDQALNGIGSRASPVSIEKILDDIGFHFKAITSPTLNHMFHIYGWEYGKIYTPDIALRRYWVCWRKGCECPLDSKVSF